MIVLVHSSTLLLHKISIRFPCYRLDQFASVLKMPAEFNCADDPSTWNQKVQNTLPSNTKDDKREVLMPFATTVAQEND